METNQHIQLLGKTAEDKITRMGGVITSVSFDLYGCLQILITPQQMSGGKYPDSRWFDVNRIQITDHHRVMPVPDFQYADDNHGPAEKPAQ